MRNVSGRAMLPDVAVIKIRTQLQYVLDGIVQWVGYLTLEPEASSVF